MQQYIKIAIIALSLVMTGVLTSCSYIYGDKGVIQNRSTDYLKARSIPPLQIPPGLSSSSIHEAYPVSNRDYPYATQEISLVPPGL
jgi:outer membrane protein assembly factor BamC